MCDEIECHSRVSAVASLWKLCPDHSACLSGSEGPPSIPLTNVVVATLGCFEGAAYAVLEKQYFDIDYRSEFSATHQTTFESRNPSTQRLHMFAGEVGKVDPLDVAKECEYLGYVVLRPQSPGAIGRSIVPPRLHPKELAVGEPLEKHIRTAVSETVDLFGQSLVAVGVPFMEQDGKLLRCVHVAAWVCHYTANLRGIVPRYRTADIYASEDDRYVLGRRYPSAGLTDEALNLVLGRTGLPADFLDPDELTRPRDPEWYDRPAIWSYAGADRWARENLTASICRYLNSGFPVILALNAARHTQVVCGYLRNGDLQSPSDEKDYSGVTHFIVHDDQTGPYRVVALTDLLDRLNETDGEELSVLAPLPPGLWLSGAVAQATGALVFRYWLQSRLANIDDWAHTWRMTPDQCREALEQTIRLLETHGAEANPQEGLAIRASAMTGTDFKKTYTSLTNDQALHRVVGFTSLPLYVWVIEVLDRSARMSRDPDLPAVVGTVVLDASEVMKRPEDAAAISTLFVHVPGQATASPTEDPADWTPVSTARRFSTRWNHEYRWLLGGDAVASRQKRALAQP